jgi:spore coat polysaccharide biosynthesis protein SpsF
MTFSTPQEDFWAGEFGSRYSERNSLSPKVHASNLAFFVRALQRTSGIRTIIELGANIGLNVRALRTLLPEAEISAIEINPDAFSALSPLCNGMAINGSILETELEPSYDLSFTKTVLIHIPPEHLDDVYRKLHEASRRYILVAEYYNPTPVSVTYRGHQDRLFKRDFSGELLDRFKDLRLIDYGFAYSRDPNHPQDDISWFLLEKGA